MRSLRHLSLIGLGLGLVGCGTPPSTLGSDGRDDTPAAHSVAEARSMCEDRRAAVLKSDQVAYGKSYLRWSCADVQGVNNNNQDDRGQEYCEYFAVVKLPGDAASSFVGWNQESSAMTLTDAQRDQLDQAGDAEVGKCVFTGWHQDVHGEVPACASPDTCPRVVDQPVTEDRFRMQMPINSNSAAYQLVKQCLGPYRNPRIPESKTSYASGYTGFMQGCMSDYQLVGTQWRKSDPAICTLAMRLTQCDCNSAGTVGLAEYDRAEALSRAMVPPQDAAVTLRGFPLGTWAGQDQLPAGCEWVSTGNEANGQPAKTIVTCSLTADDVYKYSGDLKERCRTKYGDNVVVYLPVPDSALSCASSDASCGAQPWVVTN